MRAHGLHHVGREGLPVRFVRVEECEAWIKTAHCQGHARLDFQ